MDLMSRKIRRKQLKPGDHIYTWSRGYLYSHHGIYMGHGKVIHLTRGPGFIISSSSPSQSSKDPVVRCNIKDFICKGHNQQLYRFEYGVTKIQFVIKQAGTCSLVRSCPRKDVLLRACSLLKNGFGNYNLLCKNCEDFALYCKTGSLKGDGYLIGCSGQINSLASAFFAVTSIPFRLQTISLIRVALVFGGFYSFFRLGYEVEFENQHGLDQYPSGYLGNADNVRKKKGLDKYPSVYLGNADNLRKKKKKHGRDEYLSGHLANADNSRKKKKKHGRDKYLSGHLANADIFRKIERIEERWSFMIYSYFAVFAFIIWHWFLESETLESRILRAFILFHLLFDVVADQLGLHGYNLEEYGFFYAVWLLGYRYWSSVSGLLLWIRFLRFYRFSKYVFHGNIIFALSFWLLLKALI